MKKVVMGLSVIAMASMVVGAMSISPAYAAAGKKVDCDKVMSELDAGEKPKEIAKEMGISAHSVYRCKSKVLQAKAAAAASASPAASPAEPMASPAAATP